MNSKNDPAGATGQGSFGANRELGPRLASAAVLAAAALTFTWAGVWPFVFLVAACAAVLAWEWSGIIGTSPTATDTLAHGGLLVLATVLAGSGALAAAGAVLATGAALALVRTRGSNLPLGIFYLGLPALALVALRSDPVYGFWAVLFVLVTACGADIAAYVVGRLVGGPKLAPRISPGKTWSGAAAGLVCPVVLAALCAGQAGNTSMVALASIGAILAFVSQIGDLAESALKRRAGIKDSSGLIPGHGGLLDRLDGVIAAAMVAGVIALIRDADNPGRALLIWP